MFCCIERDIVWFCVLLYWERYWLIVVFGFGISGLVRDWWVGKREGILVIYYSDCVQRFIVPILTIVPDMYNRISNFIGPASFTAVRPAFTVLSYNYTGCNLPKRPCIFLVSIVYVGGCSWSRAPYNLTPFNPQCTPGVTCTVNHRQHYPQSDALCTVLLRLCACISWYRVPQLPDTWYRPDIPRQ